MTIGVIGITNNVAISIHEIQYGIDDWVVFSWTNCKKSRAKIRYNAKGEAYFKSNGVRYYFNEAIRL